MEFTFLGTGTSQGVPIIACQCAVCQSTDSKDKRLRTAGMIQSASTTIVIDTGPDFRQQMLREKVQKLDAVVFTHQHKDHVAGLDDVRAFNYLQNRDMPLYANEETIERLKEEFSYAFSADEYPGVPKLRINQIEEAPFQIGDIDLQPIPVWHKDMKVLGFRIGSFAYITDAKTIAEDQKAKLKNLDVLVLNALQQKEHISHLTLEEALTLVEELQPKTAYFTHISHYLGLHKEVQEILPDNVFLAYDGLTLNT